MTDTTKVTAEAYLVLDPDIRPTWNGVGHNVYGIRVSRLRSHKPALARGEVAIKLRLTFLKAALLDAIPVVDVEVGGFSVGVEAPAIEAGAPDA